MTQAMEFCRNNKYDSVYLWTFKGLDSARHLYEKYGFSLTEESSGEQWGTLVTEQRFVAGVITLNDKVEVIIKFPERLVQLTKTDFAEKITLLQMP
jgi:hypothetical protein